MIGKSFEHYEIVGRLGSGGMGEVFRARDSRLNRDVALKTLPKEFASDTDRLRRFEQEAKTLAALNHPNILTVFDVGQHEGQPYLVGELLEGQTLREALNSTANAALPVRKATEYALQIAQGLAAAHGKGIIHRDLKPANIFVTKDGRVKILDFGLAKLNTVDAEAPTVVQSTVRESTEPGKVMGTPNYMAPEQVRGEHVGHRADLFAFGCVLYEMLSGRRPFKRDTSIATMAAILSEEPPDMTAMRPDLPPALERIVRRCLEKDPDNRFQSAKDLAFAIESVTGSTLAGARVNLPANRLFGAKPWLPIGTAAAALLLFGAVLALFLRRPVESAPAFYNQATDQRGTIFHARFAPDGQSIFYSAKWGNDPLAIFNAPEHGRANTTLVLPNADLLAVSRSGELAVLMNHHRSTALVNHGTLARMKVGETPRPILEDVLEADWFPDGERLLVVREVNNLCRLEVHPGGKPLCQTPGYISYPRVSPRGDRVAFMVHQVPTDNRGWVVIADLSGRTNAVSGEWMAEEGLAWEPSGREVWFGLSTNWYGRWQLRALSVSAKERPLTGLPAACIPNDVAADGRVLLNRWILTMNYVLGHGNQSTNLYMTAAGGLMDLSRDGSRYLFDYEGSGAGATYEAYLGLSDGSPALHLGSGHPLAISPDGQWVLALSYNPSKLVLLPTGVGQPADVDLKGIEPMGAGWLPDGSHILVEGHEAGQDAPRMYVQSLSGGSPCAVTPAGVVRGTGTVGRIQVSPKGDKFTAVDGRQTPLVCFSEGSEPKPVPGLTSKDQIVGWCDDNHSVFVIPANGVWPVEVRRVDTHTGQREAQPALTITQPDMAGLVDTPGLQVTPDGLAYIFSTGRMLCDLFVAVGLK
ncbi:MAG: protein kinase domain-containing protein [Limisphaerales bacterium]